MHIDFHVKYLQKGQVDDMKRFPISPLLLSQYAAVRMGLDPCHGLPFEVTSSMDALEILSVALYDAF